MDKMIIIGAGAAGMMCAVKASQYYDVTVIEKNEKPGKKLFITGKGRCNLTNASDNDIFLKNVVTNPRFLYSAINSYNYEDVMNDFESWGVKLKIERGNRVFPESDHSSDIIRALTDEMKRRGCRVLYNTEVKSLLTESFTSPNPKDKYQERVTGVILKNGKKLEADVVVLTTGGASYPTTGSTGDGYAMLKKHDIEIMSPRPALVPVVIKEKFASEMMGLSLKNVAIKVMASKEDYPELKKDKVLYQDMGEMLFTHFGVSGPLILSASSYISSFCKDRVVRLKLELDLKPALTVEELDRRVLRDFEEFHNRDFQNSLGKLLPRLMIPTIIKLSQIKPDKKVNEITAQERENLVRILKCVPMTITGLRPFAEAIITGGGISIKEINPGTMELKKIRNLRVAGEIIDCDALTGGFNLQIAWSTANAASYPE